MYRAPFLKQYYTASKLIDSPEVINKLTYQFNVEFFLLNHYVRTCFGSFNYDQFRDSYNTRITMGHTIENYLHRTIKICFKSLSSNTAINGNVKLDNLLEVAQSV
jgi:hypothetical protein